MGSALAAAAAVTVAVTHPSLHAMPVARHAGFVTDPDLAMLPPVPAVAATVRSPGAATAHITVPILVYHYVRIDANPRDRVGFGLSTPPAVFRAEMDWLREAGGHTVTLAQVMAALEGGHPLPPHPVVLTFDDGHSDFATSAVPVLLADGFVATAFVNTGFMGKPSYMTAQQVQQVAAEGMVIGDHTVNHVDLNALPAAAAREEIAADRATLQSVTGQPVLDFAYPYGDYDAQTVSIVASLGFRDAVTMRFGRTEWLAQPFTMPRMRMGGSDSVSDFAYAAGIVAPPPHWVDPSIAAPLATSRQPF
jgi:peptidoglycan/xylan/chitin deacetylase (PgdA/CDA1 family)